MWNPTRERHRAGDKGGKGGLGKTKGALKKSHARPHTRPVSSNRCADIHVLESEKIVTNPEGDTANARKSCCWCMFLMKKKKKGEMQSQEWVGVVVSVDVG